MRHLVVVTGDRHSNDALDLRTDYEDPRSAVVGTELVGTPISSGGDGEDLGRTGEELLAANPHFAFVNRQRGYNRVTVTPTQLRSDFRVLPHVSRPGAPTSTRETAVLVDRRPGLQRP